MPKIVDEERLRFCQELSEEGAGSML